MNRGFEDCERLTQEIRETLDEFMFSHWVFTQQEWENKVNIIKNNVLNEFRARINRYLADSSDFADFVVTDHNIDTVIREMKGEI